MNIKEFLLPYYENIEFDLPSGTVLKAVSDNNMTNQTGVFLSKFGAYTPPASAKLGWPTKLSIRTDQTILVYLNKTTSDPITVASTDSPFEKDDMEINNIYISNSSGSTAHVKIFVNQ